METTHRHLTLGRITTLAAALTAGAMGLTACASAPPPPTAEMQTWKSERGGDDAAAVAAAAPRLTAAADSAYRAAEAAHVEGDEELRAHHLRLADTYWETARVRHAESRARAELDQTRGDLSTARDRLATATEDMRSRRAAIAARRDDAVATGDRVRPTTPRDQAEYVLDTAVVDLARADEVNAEMRAPQLYTRAQLAYDAAALAYGNGDYETVKQRGSDATQFARQAYERAMPGWQAASVEERLAERREKLLASLLDIATPIVDDSGRVSIALIGYFDGDQTDLRSETRSRLDGLAEIVKAFPEYSVQVEGHTDTTGHPTDNLLVSQARALEVREALTDRGVDPERVTSVGHGESKAIADADLPQGDVINRRVDVVFTPRDVEVVRTDTVGRR